MTTSDITASSHRRGRAGTAGPARRREAQYAAELAPMTLDELRTYRQELIVEESRVSYWRRILQARLDLAIGDESSLGRLRGVLTEHQKSSQRLAMQTLSDAAGTPPLPDLTVLWESETGTDGDTVLLGRLTAAEQQLSAYRHSLHERLDAATGELISRYRDHPSLALHALPQRRRAGAGAA